ncbi:MAG: hypothetical protein PHC61_19205, partial [Chitinivibrionales bacterium]|nr:hypothetical protein [Chitinivibrionales bacterium]
MSDKIISNVFPNNSSIKDTKPLAIPTEKERSILRGLAEKIRAAAEHPKSIQRRKDWQQLHELKSKRPLIL